MEAGAQKLKGSLSYIQFKNLSGLLEVEGRREEMREGKKLTQSATEFRAQKN